MKKNIIKKIIDIVFQILYPPRCATCDKILEENENFYGICQCCRAIIKPTVGSICMKCGKLLLDSSKEFCKDCENKSHRFVQAKSIFEYSGPMKEAMYRFKYSNRRTMATGFARIGVMQHGDWIKGKNPRLIIPVPMYAKKENKRGYNQAELFGRALSIETGIPCDSSVIVRKRDTKPLKMLDPAQRKNNLRQAFKVQKRFKRKADVLVVDDIFTTGATIDEVSSVLKDAGVNNIYCLFICTGKCSRDS